MVIIIRKFLKIILITFFIILIIKLIFLDAYYVASESMKNSLLVGDFLIGNKAAYKIKTPNQIPFLRLSIPSFNIIEIKKPQRNDIVIFRLNEFLVGFDYSNKDLIKRIVALPGEKFELKSGKIFINDIEIENHFIFDKSNLTELNFGPIKLPKENNTIDINPKNIKFWQPIINFENNGKFISVEGTVITFKGKPIKNYIIKQNYYLVLGDNITKSVDSRIFGLIPESTIEAKVEIIYLSVTPKADSPTSNFFERIRFNRLLKSIN